MRYILALLFIFASSASTAFECHSHSRLGVPENVDQLLCRTGYLIGYNYKTKIPDFVIYHITHQSVHGFNHPRKDRFREDHDVPDVYRSRLNDYKGSGFDRGHLAPSAAIDFTPEANSETFLLSNMAPQIPGFNRDMMGYKGSWGHLENLVRKWVSLYDDLMVVAGPVYKGETKYIGASKVAVPSHYFKIVVCPKKGWVMAFLMPHVENARGDLPTYLTSVDEIEKLTGFDFFSKLNDKTETAFEAYVPPRMWSSREDESDPLKGLLKKVLD